MKILFATKGTFTVPAVEGSAIETLLTDLIDFNETHHDFDITVGAKYNEEAVSLSKNYKHTDFVYYNTHDQNKIVWLWRVLQYRFFGLFHHPVPKYLYSKQLLEQARKENYDLIVVEEGDPFSFDVFETEFGRQRMVAHVHSSWPANEKFHSIYGSIITPSRFTQNALMEGKWTDYYENGYVVPNCVNEEQFYPHMSEEHILELKKKLNLDLNSFVIVYAGRFEPNKGVLELVQAMKQLENCSLVIIGWIQSNKYKEYIEEVRDTMKGMDNIVETGFVPYAEMQKYYEIADVVVSPTTANESCCLVNLEAMFMGKPVISTYNGAVPEYIQDGKNGLLMHTEHLSDEIVEKVNILKKDKDLRKEISKYNLKDSDNYQREVYYRNMVKALKTIHEKNTK